MAKALSGPEGAGHRPSVLITSNFSNRTGFAWSSFFRLFNHLARELHDRGLGVVLSFAEIEAPVEILDDDIPHSTLVFDPLDVSWRGLAELRRSVRRHNIQYAYLTDLPTWHWLYALMRAWGVKALVTHSHISVEDPNPPPTETGLRRLLKGAIQRSGPFRSSSVFTCSEFVKDRLVRKGCCPSERIVVLHYGLPPSRFAEPAPNDDGTDSQPVRIFCAARAVRLKGIQFLIEATHHLLTDHGLSDFRIDFAGTGPDLEAFEERVGELGIESHFRFLGYVDGTTEHLRSADIVVIPSAWGDAFPYSVLEALAAGRAVVASRAGGIPEQIGDPSCGVVVPPADSAALADALAELILDAERRGQLGANASRRARERFRESDYFRAVAAHLLRAFELDDPAR